MRLFSNMTPDRYFKTKQVGKKRWKISYIIFFTHLQMRESIYGEVTEIKDDLHFNATNLELKSLMLLNKIMFIA